MGYPGLLSVELGVRIPIVCGIPDSLTCISDSDSEFHKQRIPDSSGKNFPDSLTWREFCPVNI